jgi:hypothetical protein
MRLGWPAFNARIRAIGAIMAEPHDLMAMSLTAISIK